MKLNVDNIEADLTRLLYERLSIASLERMASIVVKSEDNEGTSFSILPFDDKQAGAIVQYEDGSKWVNLDVAENTVLEIPLDGEQYTDKAGIEELFTILDGIITEGMEEIVWKKDGEIVGSIGTFYVKGEKDPVIVNCYTLHNPFAAKSKATRKYLPYIES